MRRLLENKISDEVLNKIADDTVGQIMGLTRGSRPSEIYLDNANPEYLTKIMNRMYLGFDKKKVKNITIFFGQGAYSVDVGKILLNYRLTP